MPKLPCAVLFLLEEPFSLTKRLQFEPFSPVSAPCSPTVLKSLTRRTLKKSPSLPSILSTACWKNFLASSSSLSSRQAWILLEKLERPGKSSTDMENSLNSTSIGFSGSFLASNAFWIVSLTRECITCAENVSIPESLIPVYPAFPLEAKRHLASSISILLFYIFRSTSLDQQKPNSEILNFVVRLFRNTNHLPYAFIIHMIEDKLWLYIMPI